MGFLSLVGIEGSLIILEVVPFLVLAVGVDNLFILVHSYEVSKSFLMHNAEYYHLSLVLQRQSAAHGNLPVHQLVARALGEVAPSLILTASSESAAFLLGAISNMPAVRSFSLYAGVAVFFNFLLQVGVAIIMVINSYYYFIGLDICFCELYVLGCTSFKCQCY